MKLANCLEAAAWKLVSTFLIVAADVFGGIANKEVRSMPIFRAVTSFQLQLFHIRFCFLVPRILAAIPAFYG